MNDCPLNFDELPWQYNQQFYTDLEVNCLNVVNLYLNLSVIKNCHYRLQGNSLGHYPS